MTTGKLKKKNGQWIIEYINKRLLDGGNGGLTITGTSVDFILADIYEEESLLALENKEVPFKIQLQLKTETTSKAVLIVENIYQNIKLKPSRPLHMKGILKKTTTGWKIKWYEEHNESHQEKYTILHMDDVEANSYHGLTLSYWEGREVDFIIKLTCDKDMCLCEEDNGFKNCRCNIEVARLVQHISKYCKGEKCHCGNQAIQKIEQVIFDDAQIFGHPLAQYVCQDCFDKALRPYMFNKTSWEGIREDMEATHMDVMYIDMAIETLKELGYNTPTKKIK